MTIQQFKDMLFQILNENDTFIADIELNDSGNYFLIGCIDGSRFSLSVQEAVTHFIISPDITGELIHRKSEFYIDPHGTDSLMYQLKWIAQNNPYMFQILFVVLKLSELHIISDKMARDIICQIRSYAQDLKEEWDRFHET